jgi:hypothetical protein
MKNLSMKQCLALLNKDIKALDYDFENNTIEQIVSQWWFSQFGVTNVERQNELVEMWRNS